MSKCRGLGRRQEFLFSVSFYDSVNVQMCDCVLQQNLGTAALFVLSFLLFCVRRVVERLCQIRPQTRRCSSWVKSGFRD